MRLLFAIVPYSRSPLCVEVEHAIARLEAANRQRGGIDMVELATVLINSLREIDDRLKALEQKK